MSGPAVAEGGGALLSLATRALAALRSADKPLHPRGRVRQAQLYRRGLRPPLGVEFLDTVSTDAVVARQSRSVGLPAALPDVQGLALRITSEDGSIGDLLFATTGLGRLTRFVFTLSRTPYGRPLTTLLPYRTAAGPVLMAARQRDASSLELLCSVGRDGEWRHFADLRFADDVADTDHPQGTSDLDLSFDPVQHPLPGLEQYAWVQRLRAPSYASARASRGDEVVDQTEVGRPHAG